ncbi:MAG: peptidyl-prolyl cis-trans isomerase [Gammaproteobacteria bacterium]|nr:peptidyl-prolyl cis-trans isomerase [Gammaproteobacteria bacterium]
MTKLSKIVAGALLGTSLSAQPAEPVQVLMETSLGDIRLELYPDKAPQTVENFVQYVKDKHYDGTAFHRVIKGFMIQGGGYDAQYAQRSTRAPVKNEAKNGLKNVRGSIAMARTSDPHSATAQFFINHADNPNLDFPSFDGWGYAVFGKVTQGMDVVDKIATVPTGPIPPFGRDVPVTPVVIKRVALADGKAP